jgi:hypothetical protein
VQVGILGHKFHHQGSQVQRAKGHGRVDPQAAARLLVQVARGAVDLNGQLLTAGDGAAARDLDTLSLTGGAAEAEVLLFDMAA